MSSPDVVSPDGPTDTKIETTASDEWRAAVALHGEIDIAVAPALRRELERHLDAGRRVIRVDAGGVTFIDSTAIGALASMAQRCALIQGSLILTNVSTRARRIIRITGLETVLLIDTAPDELISTAGGAEQRPDPA
jgi:anti-sigma B factor antagonist